MEGLVLKGMDKEDCYKLTEDGGELRGCSEVPWGIEDMRGGRVIAMLRVEQAGTHIVGDREWAMELYLTTEMAKKRSGRWGFQGNGAEAVSAKISNRLYEMGGCG